MNHPTADKSSSSPETDNICVSLWAAQVPFVGKIALHHWFVVKKDEQETRWEVWQSKNAGGQSWGHLHRNLMPPTAWPHKDEPQFHCQWTGRDALRLCQRIESAPQDYPWCNQYRYWPGPNSNTYVQWILLADYQLGWRAPGKRYCRFA